jgi:hypothetical protein
MNSADDVDDRDEDDPVWEKHAQQAVEEAWENAFYDEVRGVVEISDRDEPRRSQEFSNVDDLRDALAEIYRNEWFGYVPFDSGEAVFEDDAEGYVDDFLTDHQDAEEFFESLHVEDAEEEIYQSSESIEKGESKVLRVDLEEINEELIGHLYKHPEMMRELDPRKFEVLIAELLRDKGYDVTLTPRSKDGGRDILAIKRDDIGTALTLVECRRYTEGKPVGVGVVRGLFGVVSEEQASRGLIATTSNFTKGAKAFRDKVPYRLGFADFTVLSEMLSLFRKNK